MTPGATTLFLLPPSGRLPSREPRDLAKFSGLAQREVDMGTASWSAWACCSCLPLIPEASERDQLPCGVITHNSTLIPPGRVNVFGE